MLVKRYRVLFFAKIFIGAIASLWFLYYYIVLRKDPLAAVVFVIDMQESMATQDVFDASWVSHTRQEAAVQYISQSIQSISTGTDIGVIRLGYYPDYIVPLTRDFEVLSSYIASLANSPTSPTLVYQTGDISLEQYYSIAPNAHYVLLTDKQSTIDAVRVFMPTVQSVLIDATNSKATIHQREDTMQTVSYRQWWYLWWIFVLITIVWLILL